MSNQLEQIRTRVEVIQHMGDDLTPVKAARVSFNKDSEFEITLEGKKLKAADRKLLWYLARNKHWTPFAHTAITFRISMPIYIARQWFKHQIGFVYNEVSRRYVDDTPEFEFGVPWRKRPEKSVKQGSGEEFDFSMQNMLDTRYAAIMNLLNKEYAYFIELGTAPEQARKILPFSTYTEFWQTGNLESFARLCRLRLDPHAQLETRNYAAVISEHMERLFPEAWAAQMRDPHKEEVDALKAQIASLENQVAELKWTQEINNK